MFATPVGSEWSTLINLWSEASAAARDEDLLTERAQRWAATMAGYATHPDLRSAHADSSAKIGDVAATDRAAREGSRVRTARARRDAGERCGGAGAAGGPGPVPHVF